MLAFFFLFFLFFLTHQLIIISVLNQICYASIQTGGWVGGLTNNVFHFIHWSVLPRPASFFFFFRVFCRFFFIYLNFTHHLWLLYWARIWYTSIQTEWLGGRGGRGGGILHSRYLITAKTVRRRRERKKRFHPRWQKMTMQFVEIYIISRLQIQHTSKPGDESGLKKKKKNQRHPKTLFDVIWLLL